MRVDIPFKVEKFDGTTAEGRIRFLDYFQAERHFGMNMIAAYRKNGTEADLYCAWAALRREGKEPEEDFQVWAGTVAAYQETAAAITEATEVDTEAIEEEEQGEAQAVPLAPVASTA